MVSRQNWDSISVFVTGIAGFVGASLTARLIDLGARVIGLVRDMVPQSSLAALGLEGKATLVRGDLADLPLLVRILHEYEVEVVFHLGAQAIVGAAQGSPLATFRSNIEGTWNLLEACRTRPALRAVIVASSDKAYGSHRQLPYTEDLCLLAANPYDASKACADLLGRAYWHTYKVPVVVSRFANLYGPADLNFSRIIPDTIRSVLQGVNPVIRSDGTLERDYLWIGDAVDAYLLLAEGIEQAGVVGEAFNAGGGRPIRVLDLVETIIRLVGRSDLRPEVRGRGTPHGEIDRQFVDGSKLKRTLGWEPKVPLEDGLKRTLEWYEGYFTRRGLPGS